MCDICDILKAKEEFQIIYEDNVAFCLLHESPAMPGHTLVIPKKHYRIIEEVPDEEISQLFIIANTISTLIFDTTGAMGTNIIVNNGIAARQEQPHLIINVVPRKENDSLNFEWPPKKASEQDLKASLDLIGAVSDEVFFGREKNKPIEKDIKVEKISGDDNYLLKQLRRLP